MVWTALEEVRSLPLVSRVSEENPRRSRADVPDLVIDPGWDHDLIAHTDVDTSVADADRDRTGYEHDDFLDVTSVVDPDISHIADAHLKTESQVLPNDPNLFIRGHVYPV